MAEQQPSYEERLSSLEKRFAAFELLQAQQAQTNDTIYTALLQRIDSFIATISRMDRDQLKLFQSQLDGFKSLGLRIDSLEKAISQRFGQLEADMREILADHKAGLERNHQEIQAVDQKIDQVIALLSGQQRHD